ncbi:hypothetical protein ASD31_14745 [Rhizobium sp. Root482]|nr:hypothetical protein ASD31_14745 [Rhizobium sp. Root482]
MTALRDAADAASLGSGAIDATQIADVLDSGPYLMELADVVVSDMSGAIFDSLYCRKPLVLLSLGRDLEAHAKADPSALEIAHTDRIGPLVLEPQDLHDAVELMLGDNHPYTEVNEELVRESFVQRGGCAAIAAAGIRSFIVGEPQHHDLQAYVASNVRTAILGKAHDAAMRRLSTTSKAQANSKAVKATTRSPRKLSPVTKALNRLPASLLVTLAKISHHAGMPRAESYLYFRSRDASGREAATRSLAETSATNKSHTTKLNIRATVPKGAAARQELLRRLQDQEEFFGLGLCIEDWARSRPDVARRALYQFYCAAANLRFSRTKNRALHNALVAFANDSQAGTTQVRRAILRDLGYLSEAVALGSSEADEAQTKLVSAANLLGPLAKYLDIAAANEATGLLGQAAITPDGEWLPVGDIKAPIFEMSLMLGFARIVGEENDGAREAMLSITQNAVDALRRRGWAILPRIQAGHRGAVPISSEFPSATWHTTHSGVDGQIHLKVGPLNSHIIIDDRGYSGWSSLAHKPLAEIISNISRDEAEVQYANLYETLVATGRSKYKQQTEPVPDVGKYIFYPMQVMTDTVARLAHINGLRLLQVLAEWGKMSGYKIIVKRHPKCTVAAVKKAIEREQKAGSIVVSNASIHELIAGAEAVVAVNSGVGAEALIHLKPVITTGDSDYAAATTLTRNEAELAEALSRIGTPLTSSEDIKRFLWTFTKRYQVHEADRDATFARFGELTGQFLKDHERKQKNTAANQELSLPNLL